MILDEIISKTKINLENIKENLPLCRLENALTNSYIPRDVKQVLKQKNSINIIAEIKNTGK